MNHVEHLLI